METDGSLSSASQAAIDSVEKLYNAIKEPFPDAVSDFESKWTAAQAVCHPPTTSSIEKFIQSDEFIALKRLGPKIIPFVVFKLTRDAEQNSFGVLLYNALEEDAEYRVNLDGTDVSPDALRSHSPRITELNHRRNTLFEQRATAWKDHCYLNHLQSSSSAFTECDEYEDLLKMGPSIIAHIMVEYYHDYSGYWFELLHEIIHGHKMGAVQFQKGGLCAQWFRFFNEREHGLAFRYVETPFDRYIRGEGPLPE